MIDGVMDQHSLLRHVLSSRKDCDSDKDLLYAFLLGSRLFLSPHQLLHQIQHMTQDETSSNLIPCSKCNQVHTPTRHTSTPRPLVTSQTTTSLGNPPVMRRKRGRRQRISSDSNSTQAFSSRPISMPSYHDFRLSIYSRDSGVLSVVFDDVNILDVPQGGNLKTPNTLSTTNFRAESIASLLDQDLETVRSTTQLDSTPSHNCHCRSERLMEVLQQWVSHFPADFRNKKIMSTLNDVMKRCQSENKVRFVSIKSQRNAENLLLSELHF